MSFIKATSGTNWFYDREGQGAVLLFLHGWSVDHRIWRQQFKYFSSNFDVLTVDLPGHGKTEFNPLSLEEMAEDLKCILEKLGVGDFQIAASSFGGLVAMKLYEMMNESVKSMSFVGSMPKFYQSNDYLYAISESRREKLIDQLENAYPEIVHIFFRSLFTIQERSSRRYQWLQKFKTADIVPAKDVLCHYLSVMDEEDLRDVFFNMDIPVQFINGLGDAICTPQIVNSFKEKMPEASYYDFEECGHFPFLTEPYEFNKILEEFLCQVLSIQS